MTNEETVKDIDIAIMLEGASECSCDPEVGWVCERCFVISTLESAKRLLTPLAPDGAVCPAHQTYFEEDGTCAIAGCKETRPAGQTIVGRTRPGKRYYGKNRIALSWLW